MVSFADKYLPSSCLAQQLIKPNTWEYAVAWQILLLMCLQLLYHTEIHKSEEAYKRVLGWSRTPSIAGTDPHLNQTKYLHLAIKVHHPGANQPYYFTALSSAPQKHPVSALKCHFLTAVYFKLISLQQRHRLPSLAGFSQKQLCSNLCILIIQATNMYLLISLSTSNATMRVQFSG